MVNRFLFTFTIAFLFISGCENADKMTPKSQLEKIRKENLSLNSQISQYKSQTENLTEQIKTLSVLKDKIKPEDIYNLQKIKISRFTNFYDEDSDGKKESLIVYFQPIDDCGDVVKAGGSIEVQLWDLSKPASPSPGGKDSGAMIGQWKKDSIELKKLWYSGLMGANYRLTFDVTGKIEKLNQPLTLNVTFTDYLTGRVFTEQKIIKP
jgi:hypothetical protein